MNSVFNFAIKRKLYDENPVRAVPQFVEPPGRDRFTTPQELKQIFAKCDVLGDIELKAFIVIAATTGMRKGEILPRKYSEVRLDEVVPYIYVGRTKNGEPKKVPLPALAIEAIRHLPSYGKDEYLFPAKANVRFRGAFKKPHAWDIGKRFRRTCKLAGISDLRIHDLRHFAATTLFIKGIPEAIIAKMTGHKSLELRRYEHLSPTLKQQTVELIAGELGGEVSDSRTDTPSNREHVSVRKSLKNGGADGTRTRDLRRDRPAF
jgi:integrase